MHNSYNGPSNDNQFMQIDLEQSNVKKLQQLNMKNSRSVSHDVLIDKLQQKNINLKKQVNKIDKVLSNIQLQSKPRYGLVLPQIKPDALKKQLQNAYKQIKLYQHQLQRTKNKISSQSAYVEQINKIQKLYKQKLQIHERLKRQMLIIKNQSKQLIKYLKNNNKKLSYQNKQLKLSTDVKYLHQQLREYQQKKIQHITLLEKQKNTIKLLEKQVIEQNSQQFLQNIKMKIFKPDQYINNTLTPSRSIIDIENQTSNQQSRLTKIYTISEQIQLKKTSSLESIQNDIRILRKIHNDHQAKINLISKQKDQAAQKNFKSRNKLLEVQFEIQNIQKHLLQLKKLIDPKMLKPLHAQPLHKKTETIKKIGPSISHNYKYVQIGQITKCGKRFSDRVLIGKKDSKIVAIKLYQNKQTLQFLGFQCSYLIQAQKSIIKKGNLNLLIDPKKQQLIQQSLQLLQGDYFKTIDLFTKKGKIVGISMNSFKNKIIKIGELDGQRNILQMKQLQYPMCIYGSILKDGFECFGVEIYTIQDDKNCFFQQK